MVLVAGCQADQALAPQIAVDVRPARATVPTGGALTFDATVANDAISGGVTWTLSCSSSACGTLSATSSVSGEGITYTAPAVAPTPASVKVMATSVTDRTRHATATVAITTAVISVSITPTATTLPVSNSQSFTATVANDPLNAGVTWTLTGPGTLSATSSASGVAISYTATATTPTPPTVTVTAASVTDPTRRASAPVTITTPVLSVYITPDATTLLVSTSQQFTASVLNDVGNAGVTWTVTGAGCSGATCGTLSATNSASWVVVTYTAPAMAPTPGTVTLTATSVTDIGKSAAAVVSVVTGLPTTVRVTSNADLTTSGQSVTLTATVTLYGWYEVPPSGGSVTFQDGGSGIANCTAQQMQRGQATCVTSTLSIGTHSITATYNGTADFAPSTSTPLHQVILARSAATTVTLTSSANPSLFGQPVTFTATVTAASGPVTGTVTFYTDDPWASRPMICYASP